MPRFSVVACTVGTSVLSNLERERASGSTEVTRALSELQAGRAADAATYLAHLPSHLLGAEVSSLESMWAGGPYSRADDVVLLHSDTDDGAAAAQMVRVILAQRRSVLARTVRVEGLSDQIPSRFKVQGLRSLVRLLAKELRDLNQGCSMVVNATGGYKAQIAVAVVFGQVLGVPVIYQHERFQEFIELPPLPVSLDTAQARSYVDLLHKPFVTVKELLNRIGPLAEGNAAYAAFRVFLGDYGTDASGEEGYWLSPMAELVIQAIEVERSGR